MSVRRVLVVHDDTDFRRIYRAALEHAGFDVVDTDDPIEARQAFDLGSIALVVCDLYIRMVADESFVSWLKRDPRAATVPVMVVTAWGSESHRIVATNCGADTFLRLPVAPKTLLEEVQRVLGPLPPESAFVSRLTSPRPEALSPRLR
ncbi:MAG TPA: response regulator [Gemmatimonadaceae bacterium]|nr:response regulator [Gemmatimonadaceae bacterium]